MGTQVGGDGTGMGASGCGDRGVGMGGSKDAKNGMVSVGGDMNSRRGNIDGKGGGGYGMSVIREHTDGYGRGTQGDFA